jgi:hypothetical protein
MPGDGTPLSPEKHREIYEAVKKDPKIRNSELGRAYGVDRHMIKISGLSHRRSQRKPRPIRCMSLYACRRRHRAAGLWQGWKHFTFVQKVESITFPEAVRLMGDKLKTSENPMSFYSPEEERISKLRGGLLYLNGCRCNDELIEPDAITRNPRFLARISSQSSRVHLAAPRMGVETEYYIHHHHACAHISHFSRAPAIYHWFYTRCS